MRSMDQTLGYWDGSFVALDARRMVCPVVLAAQDWTAKGPNVAVSQRWQQTLWSENMEASPSIDESLRILRLETNQMKILHEHCESIFSLLCILISNQNSPYSIIKMRF